MLIKTSIVLLVSGVGLYIIGTSHIQEKYQLFPYLLGSGIFLNLIPLIICGLVFLIGGKRVKRKLFPVYLLILVVSLFFAWRGVQLRPIKVIQNSTAEKSRHSIDRGIFESEEYMFSAVFPEKSLSQFLVTDIDQYSKRFQSLAHFDDDNFVIYSVTATRDPNIPPQMPVEEVLETNGGWDLSLTGNEEFKRSMKWGENSGSQTLYYDSNHNHDGNEYPKRTILIYRPEDKMVFNISVIASYPMLADLKFKEFYGTFSLME
jgi:hypothetical protein